MLDRPIFSQLSAKTFDIIFVSLVTIIYIGLCAEADMYVPAFPQMIEYFGIAENKISLILSINFVGLSISGLVVGPLSDCYGRRRVLLGGIFLFVISSIGCVVTSDFTWMLGWRFVQGLAAAVPMVVAAASFFDKYTPAKAGKIIGFLNSIISASMAGAPVVGAYISDIFDWRANFIVILALALVSFIGTLLFIEETLPIKKRKIFHPISVVKDYWTITKSLKFMSYTIIGVFPITVIILYVANLSVIMINHLGIDLVTFSYYQATTMGAFMIFSLISIKMIDKYGVDFTKNFGGIIAAIGSFGMFYVGQFDHTNANMISFAMVLIASGGAMMMSTFTLIALSVFPDMNGTAMAMMTAIRQLLASGLVIVSEVFFDGTIMPIANIIFVYAIISIICYVMASCGEVKQKD